MYDLCGFFNDTATPELYTGRHTLPRHGSLPLSGPALSPGLMNLSMISAALFLAPLLQSWGYDPVLALAWGVFVAGSLQLAFQLPSLARLGLLPRPRDRKSTRLNSSH